MSKPEDADDEERKEEDVDEGPPAFSVAAVVEPSRHRLLLPLMPLVAESLGVGDMLAGGLLCVLHVVVSY